MLDIGDPDTDQGVRVAGQRERLDELWQVGYGPVDVVDLGSGGKAQLRERLELAAQQAMVEDRGVSADDAGALQPVDPPLGGRGREADEAADLTGRAASIVDEQLKNALVDSIQTALGHVTIVRRSRPRTQIFLV